MFSRAGIGVVGGGGTRMLSIMARYPRLRIGRVVEEPVRGAGSAAGGKCNGGAADAGHRRWAHSAAAVKEVEDEPEAEQIHAATHAPGTSSLGGADAGTTTPETGPARSPIGVERQSAPGRLPVPPAATATPKPNPKPGRSPLITSNPSSTSSSSRHTRAKSPGSDATPNPASPPPFPNTSNPPPPHPLSPSAQKQLSLLRSSTHNQFNSAQSFFKYLDPSASPRSNRRKPTTSKPPNSDQANRSNPSPSPTGHGRARPPSPSLPRPSPQPRTRSRFTPYNNRTEDEGAGLGLLKAKRDLGYRSVLVEDVTRAEQRFFRFLRQIDSDLLRTEGAGRGSTSTSGRKTATSSASPSSTASSSLSSPGSVNPDPNPDPESEPAIHNYPYPTLTTKELNSLILGHLNHLLYLSARIPSGRHYNRFKRLMHLWKLDEDEYTLLARLVLRDRMDPPRVGINMGDGRGQGYGDEEDGGMAWRGVRRIWEEWERVLWRRREKGTYADAGGEEVDEASSTSSSSSRSDRGQGHGAGIWESEDRRAWMDVEEQAVAEKKGSTVLMNQIMWMLGKRAEWQVVGRLYNQLLETTPEAMKDLSVAFASKAISTYFTPSHSLGNASSRARHGDDRGIGEISFGSDTQLDKITYQALIRTLAFRGNIIPALSILGDMLKDTRRYSADISDYVAIMQGFARFGKGPSRTDGDGEGRRRGSRVVEEWIEREEEGDDQGDVLELFPPPIWPDYIPIEPVVEAREVELPVSGKAKSRNSRAGGGGGGLKRITEIWAGTVDNWAKPGTPSEGENNPHQPEGLTLSILEKVFSALLATPPPHIPENTPPPPHPKLPLTPRGTFIILLAFSRCTNGDAEALRSVWLDLENKFGAGNEEGWGEWKVDKRMERIRLGLLGKASAE